MKQTLKQIFRSKAYTTSVRILFLVSLLLFTGLAVTCWAKGYNQPSGAEKSQEGAVLSEKTISEEPCDEQIAGLDTVSCDDDYSTAENMLTGSYMAGLGKQIVDIANEYKVSWRIIIGLAKAESNLGEHYYFKWDKENCFNAWGIKPPKGQRDDGSYLRCFNDWDSGIRSMAGLLSRRYKDQTPEQMCGRYVVPCNPNWLITVNKYYE